MKMSCSMVQLGGRPDEDIFFFFFLLLLGLLLVVLSLMLMLMLMRLSGMAGVMVVDGERNVCGCAP